MGILDFFKKPKTPSFQNPFNILDEFSIDITSLDKNNFDEDGEEVNSMGSKIVKYSTYLDDYEFQIFNRLSFIEFESGERSVFFEALLQGLSISKLIELVNRLVDGYGKDSSGSGKFENWEIKAIERMTWTGRMWTDISPSIMLTQDGAFIELGILGINIKDV